jgi:hypothetical protein
MASSNQLPKDDAPKVWALQNTFLKTAEDLLGPRDPRFIICQPRFWAGGPHILHLESPNVVAELSMSASGYWPTLYYELGHETVHLLNPVVGPTSWLEEGIAVAFSVFIQGSPESIKPELPRDHIYAEAWKLVSNLPGGPYEFGKAVRAKFGGLCGFSQQDLMLLYPSIDHAVAIKLTETCIPR